MAIIQDDSILEICFINNYMHIKTHEFKPRRDEAELEGLEANNCFEL